MKKVLITGAYGFLGKYSALAFHQSGYKVTGIGHGKWYEHEYKVWGISRWVESTVTFESLININEKFDIIIHCGGSASVAFSYQNPFEDFQKSVQSTLSILEFIRLQNPDCKLIYPSSPAVQGDLGDILIKENAPFNPISPYGFHKKIAEEICMSYSKSFGLDIAIIRFFSIYGVGLKKQLLWDACMKIKNAAEEVSFFGTGDETRDWINVIDAAKLIVSVSTIATKLEIINGGSGVKVPIRSIINLLLKSYGKDLKVTFNNIVKEGDPRFYHADITKALALGWNPGIPLENGIRDYVDFFKKTN